MPHDEKINLLHLALQECILTYEAKVKDFNGENSQSLKWEDIVSYKEKITYALNELSEFQKLLEEDDRFDRHAEDEEKEKAL